MGASGGKVGQDRDAAVLRPGQQDLRVRYIALGESGHAIAEVVVPHADELFGQAERPHLVNIG